MTTEPRFIAMMLISAGIAYASLSGPAAAQDPWTQVGPASRPAWVLASTERRLNLLPALPGMKTTMQGQANAYFGAQGPGLSVGLVLDTGLFYSQGFGFADAAKTREPDDTTVYRVGSVTKVVTAATLLTLVDKKIVTMGDLAVTYVPELKNVRAPGPAAGPSCSAKCNIAEGGCMQNAHSVAERQACIAEKKQCAAACPPPTPPVAGADKIKLLHLVSHTSGLPNEMTPAEANEATWLTELQGTKLAFSPGDYAAYSGVGVELAALIVKRKSGKNFDAYMKDSLLKPLGMTSTHLDHNLVPANLLAQKYVYSWPAGQAQPSFAVNSSWDNPQMLIPAGNLFTSVVDFSRFIQMELAQWAPNNILTTATIQASQTSAVASAPAPGPCYSVSDAPGSSYSPCRNVAGFGFGWFVGNTPFVDHSGSWGNQWGSQTRLDIGNKMGATGMISTDPYPQAPSGLTAPPNMDAVVYGLLTAGLAADKATTWSGQALAIGVARVLYLSGKNPAQSDLDAFTPQFVAVHKLDKTNVVAFLIAWKNKIGACSTFRVRDVETANKITVRFRCAKDEWETTLVVQGAPFYQVAWSTEVAQSPGPTCAGKCNVAEGTCMKQAHSVADRQACISDKKECVATCK